MVRLIFVFLLLCIFCPCAFASEEPPEIWTCSYTYLSPANSSFTYFERSLGPNATNDTIIERFVKKGNILQVQSDDSIGAVPESFQILLDNDYGLIATRPVADERRSKELDTGGITAFTVVIDKKASRYTMSVVRANHLVASEERRGTCMKNS